MITFSFRPRSRSTLPLIAASVRTRVVSWKDAADSHDVVARGRGGRHACCVLRGPDQRLGDHAQDGALEAVLDLPRIERLRLILNGHAQRLRLGKARPLREIGTSARRRKGNDGEHRRGNGAPGNQLRNQSRP